MLDKDNTFASCLGMIVSVLVLFVVGMFLNGWALSTIWNWFIPPVFGLTALTLGQAVGVSMVFELFTGTNRLTKSKDTEGKSYTEVFIESLITAILTPVFSVFFAWIVWAYIF